MLWGRAMRCHGGVENLLGDQVTFQDEGDEIAIPPKDLAQAGVAFGALINDRPHFFLRSSQPLPRCLTCTLGGRRASNASPRSVAA